MRDTALPSAVRGPVDFSAFLRFASIFLSDTVLGVLSFSFIAVSFFGVRRLVAALPLAGGPPRSL